MLRFTMLLSKCISHNIMNKLKTSTLMVYDHKDTTLTQYKCSKKNCKTFSTAQYIMHSEK